MTTTSTRTANAVAAATRSATVVRREITQRDNRRMIRLEYGNGTILEIEQSAGPATGIHVRITRNGWDFDGKQKWPAIPATDLPRTRSRELAPLDYRNDTTPLTNVTTPGGPT